MARVPAAGVMTSSPKDPLVLRDEEEQRRESVAQMTGAALDTTYTIGAGDINPTVSLFAVDTEGGAASDDLDRLMGENDLALPGFPQHGIVILRAANTARTVNVRHLAGGPWDVSLAIGTAFALDDDRKQLALQLRGTRWFEIGREWGNDLAGARAALAVTLLATLANPGPSDEGKFIGASAGAIGYTQAAPGGHGFTSRSENYPGTGRVYASGAPVRFERVEIGDPEGDEDGFIFAVPQGAIRLNLECNAELERQNENAQHDFVTLRAAPGRKFSSQFPILVFDATAKAIARGLPSQTVYFRPQSENDRLREPYLSIAGLVVPVTTGVNGTAAVRIEVEGISANSYRVRGGRARSSLSLQWSMT